MVLLLRVVAVEAVAKLSTERLVAVVLVAVVLPVASMAQLILVAVEWVEAVVLLAITQEPVAQVW
jgi:hypothetical protein